MRLRQIRNATVVVECAGTRLLVDPWLDDKGAGFTAQSPWPERFRPDVTVLNCCGATTATRGRIIMDEEDLLRVCEAAPFTHVVASHLDAVNHGRVSRPYLRALMDRMGFGAQVSVPADGEWLEFGCRPA